MIVFTVPGAPVATNQAYRVVRFGKRAGIAMTAEGAAWKQAFAVHAKLAMRGREPFRECEVRLALFFPDRRGDIDGPLKLAIDGMADGGVFALPARPNPKRKNPPKSDDRWVRRVELEKFLDRRAPRTVVTVTERILSVAEVDSWLRSIENES